jgi:hypothetical protein
MQQAGYELPRIPIPRTPVNKGMKKAGPPWRGVNWRTRLNNDIVTSCNILINRPRRGIYRNFLANFGEFTFHALRCIRA